jgi:DNA-binding PadR family transcriptional regulator
MALRHALLAALLQGEASGYQLAKRFDVSVANFWSATPQQLYRELEGMEAAGAVTACVVEQQRRPNKRLFAITDAGREELAQFSARPPRPSALRDELLVQLHAVDIGDRDTVMASIRERMQQARGKLAIYERLREELLAGRSETDYLREADRVGPYLTLMRGLSFEQENLTWGEKVLDILTQRAGVAI